jgi:fatty acid desaturase
MLRNIRDWKGVAFILTIATIQMSLFLFVENIFVVVIAVAALVPFQVSASALNHNHHHCLTFRSTLLNRAYECVMFLQTGTSPFAWTLHHNIGHHERFLDQSKDTSPWKTSKGKVMSRGWYCLRNTIMMYPGAFRVGWSHKPIFFRFLSFLGVSSVLLAALILGSPLKALLIFVIPMTMMLFILVDATYGHHAGLDTDDPYKATYNILDPVYNFCAWNLGYHTAHHLRPGLHWTSLPDFHSKISEKIPGALIREQWDMKLSTLKMLGRKDSTKS